MITPEAKRKRISSRTRINITGEVLRILPFKEVKVGDEIKKVTDIIIADEFDYMRISLWDEKTELVLNHEIEVGDVLRIENAYISEQSHRRSWKRATTGRYAKIKKIPAEMHALSRMKPLHLTVLAVTRSEKGQVCVAGIDESGEWIRPQGIYESDVFGSGGGKEDLNFKNLCISTIYVDAWRGENPRKEDRFFIRSGGIIKELSETEQWEFLEKNVDSSVDSVFKSGRSLGLIKPRILHVYEEKKAKEGKKYEQYIRFNFKDPSGRIYRRWSCRCDTFYKAWNELKEKKRWTYGWRMLRYLRKNNIYLTIGLTYTSYGIEKLEYGTYPMIVGVHVLPKKPS